MAALFIVFEGVDGVGKTTQVKLLHEWLSAAGHEVCVTHEPGGTGVGQVIRSLLLNKDNHIAPKAEALLYAADRAQHAAEVIEPALARGDVVVQDRYIFSSLAYQGAGRVLELEFVREISEWATGGLWPDITFLLDLDIEKAAGRRTGRQGGPDRLESEKKSFHDAVRQGFLDLAASAPAKTVVLDASKSPEEIAAEVREEVSLLL